MTKRCLPALIYCSLGLLIVMLSAGCSAQAGGNLPTPYPTEYLPTVLAMTVEAGRQEKTASAQPTATRPTQTPRPTTARPTATSSPVSPKPSATRTPQTPLPTPTRTRIPSRTPTITPTPGIPPGEIQFSRPGPMSKVISPLDTNVYYHSEPGGYLLVELLAEPLQSGQAGRLLLSKLQRFGGGEPFWATYNQDLEFEIGRVSEFAALRFSIFDSFERPAAVSSVDLLLLQVGNNEFNPSGSLLEPIAIFEPPKNKLIQGGTLEVSGMTRPEGDQILHFELVTEDKRVVGTRDLFTVPAPDGKHIPFATTIDYSVSEATWVRLIAYYLDPRIPGYRQLASVPILLSP
jgi:hypothetical protein